MADLSWLIQIGKGNRPVTETQFRCKDCGEIVEKQVRPPVPTIGGSVAYISLVRMIAFRPEADIFPYVENTAVL